MRAPDRSWLQPGLHRQWGTSHQWQLGQCDGLRRRGGHAFHCDYDKVGNVLTRTQMITNQVTLTTTYGYDAANRLTAVNGVTYTWDNNGNLLSDGAATYGYVTANRLTSILQGGHTYAYTYSGNGDGLTQNLDRVVTRYTLDNLAGPAV